MSEEKPACLEDHDDDIVISGIGGRYPRADNIDEFWDILMSGEELSDTLDTRWPAGEGDYESTFKTNHNLFQVIVLSQIGAQNSTESIS